MDNKNKVVTFDFDGCLSMPHVQEYAKELLDKGYEVWVVTARFDQLNLHRYINRDWNNDDLWEVVDRLEIPRWKVRFMNMESKANYLATTTAIWHLDDDHIELFDIRNFKIRTKGIQVNSGTWKNKCNKLLNNE